MLNRVRRAALALIVNHVRALYRAIDPVQPPSITSETTKNFQKNRETSRHQYLTPVIEILFTLVYGILFAEYMATGTVRLCSLHASPHIYTHQCLPELFRRQIDIGYLLDTTFALGSFIVLIWQPAVMDAHRMSMDAHDRTLVRIGRNGLSREESSVILAYRKLIRAVMLAASVVLYVSGIFLFAGYAWWSHGDTLRPHMILFWTVLFPIYFLYCIYALYTRIAYVLLAAGYMRLLQRMVLENVQSINGRLARMSSSSDVVTVRDRNLLDCWIAYHRTNRRLVTVARLTEVYARCASPTLSIIGPFYIALQCYMMHVALFMPETPVSYRRLFMVSVVEVNVCMFAAIRQCAGLVRINSRLEGENRRFALFYGQLGGFRLLAPVRDMLKAENNLQHRRLHQYAFRVVGNYRITSKTYSVIISYISIFFMFVYKDQTKRMS